MMADETILKRILTNLSANEIHYGTGWLQITVTEDDLIVVFFENEIADGECPDVERTFELLNTADASRSRSGSGSGLYIVKLPAERMAEKVSANLTEPAGSLSDWPLKKHNIQLSAYSVSTAPAAARSPSSNTRWMWRARYIFSWEVRGMRKVSLV